MPSFSASSAGRAAAAAVDAQTAKWCAAFFDGGQAASPMPNRSLGLYRATLAAIAYDPEFRALAGETGQQLLLTVPRDPLEAIAEGLVALGIADPRGSERLGARERWLCADPHIDATARDGLNLLSTLMRQHPFAS